MMGCNWKFFALILALSSLFVSCLGQLLLDDDNENSGKPWPTYSLQNMPKTQFTCHDKILGGYYADPETQCQMFHVCVKLPGVGLIHRKVNSFAQQVQDYRFLCPNSTAFDQELQICANWADVDCDKAVLYYDNNHFNDLYRSNSPNTVEQSSKGDEEEATFHLQRAESGDVRRNKEQKSRNYGRNNYANVEDFNGNTQQQQQKQQPSKKPISSYYTPTTTTTTKLATPSTTTTRTTTTTERSYYNSNNNHNNYHSNNNYNSNNNNNDDSKQDVDDIFKGSHSSHFFANRHGGREYDDDHSPPAASSSSSSPKSNDFTDFNRKTTDGGKLRATPTRGSRISSSSAAVTPTTTTTTERSITRLTTSRPGSSITSRFSFGVADYHTQDKIQPTTYNPNSATYRIKTTPAPQYTPDSTKVQSKNAQDFDKSGGKRNKPTAAVIVRKHKLGPQESNYINHNEFTDLPKARLQQPQPFQAAKQQTAQSAQQLEPQYHRARGQQQQQQQQVVQRVGPQEPAPFSAPKAIKPSNKPRAFTSRGSITYKATTQRYTDDELHYPTTTTATASRDAFTPTTFKPTTYKKSYEPIHIQHTQRPHSPIPTRSTTHSVPTTTTSSTNPDEDDGQYHPELYESDFPRNRFKFLRDRSTTSTTTTTTSAPVSNSRQSHGFNHNFQQAHSHLRTQQQSAYQKEREQAADLSDDEDELFKTAQSLNFGAASINKLRADIYKAEKTSQQYNSQYSPNAVSPSGSIQTTSRPFSSSSSSTYFTTSTTTGSSLSSSSSTTPSTTTTTTTTTTTRRPTTTVSTTVAPSPPKSPKGSKKGDQQQQEKKPKSTGKRPPFADADTSYDYAYYDTD